MKDPHDPYYEDKHVPHVVIEFESRLEIFMIFVLVISIGLGLFVAGYISGKESVSYPVVDQAKKAKCSDYPEDMHYLCMKRN